MGLADARNGHLDELLYEHGAIATNLAFAEIKRRSLINPAAKLADLEVDFSRRIRQDLPAANP